MSNLSEEKQINDSKIIDNFKKIINQLYLYGFIKDTDGWVSNNLKQLYDIYYNLEKKYKNMINCIIELQKQIDIENKNQNEQIDQLDLIFPYKNLKEVFLYIKDLYNISEKINIEKPQYIKMPEWLFRWFVIDGHFIYKIKFETNDYYMIGCKIIVSYNIKELQEIEVY